MKTKSLGTEDHC